MFNNNLKAPFAAFIAFACFTGPAIDQFRWKTLGPGYDVTTPPPTVASK